MCKSTGNLTVVIKYAFYRFANRDIDTSLMPRSQMAYDASATPLRRIFPQFLAMIVQFYGAGKATAAIIAARAATADSLTRS